MLAGLALAGATFASIWMVRMLVALAPATVPRMSDVGTGAETLIASAALALVIGVALAIVPAWVAAHADVRGVLQDGSRGAAGASRAGTRLRTTLVVAEVALAVVITIQAGLLFRSFSALLATDPGFTSEHLLTLEMNTPERTTMVEVRRAFYQEWFSRVAALPGVEAVGGTTRIPLGSSSVTTSVRAEGNAAPPAALPEVEFRRGSPDYFRAMGMPLVRGRGFLASDLPTDPPLVVINQTLARLSSAPSIRSAGACRPGPTERQLAHGGRRGRRRAPQFARSRAPPELYVNMAHNPATRRSWQCARAESRCWSSRACAGWPRSSRPRLALYDIRTMDDLRTAALAERRSY